MIREITASVNDQPIAASFFDEAIWLTSYITPNALEVKNLYSQITQGIVGRDDKILALWDWVANNIKYVKFVKGQLRINNLTSIQNDYWQMPSMCIQTGVGNCANKTFLLTSLLRGELLEHEVSAVLGNLRQPGEGGHAWVELRYQGEPYIVETTRADMPPFVPSSKATIYEPVIYFNDKEVSYVPGRTLIEPFCDVYIDWLSDYLHQAYVGGK